jgi:hypothetical protein
MASFAPQLALTDVAPLDPSKHVNYTLGMVLRDAEFKQDFAYLSERDRWLAREVLGYGTVSGLAVAYETSYNGPDRGPRLSVSPGVALSPAGRLVRVMPAQCAYLDDWLTANRDRVLDTASPPATPPGSPPAGPLALSVVLCYRDCPTDEVPIPGEPCRSEDDLLAPSRLRDDFTLELRFEPPDQREEDAVRRFAAWLAQVEVTDTASGSLDQFLDEIRLAARGAASPPGSPCPSLDDFMAQPPPTPLEIPRVEACAWLSAALLVWITELRPCWQAAPPGGCDPGTPHHDPECVLLAEVDVPVQVDALTGELSVGPEPVEVHEERRPRLAHLRLLQELLLCGPAGGNPGSPPGLGPQPPHGLLPQEFAAPPAAAPAGPVVVAAGRFDADGAHSGPQAFSFGGLEATPRGGAAGVFDLDFDDFDPDARYLVTGCVLNGEGGKAATIEVVPDDHLVVRVRTTGRGADEVRGFMVEVTRFGGAG